MEIINMETVIIGPDFGDRKSIKSYRELIPKDNNLIKIMFINCPDTIDHELLLLLMDNGWQIIINNYELYQRVQSMKIDVSKSSIRYTSIHTEEEKIAEIESLVYPRSINDSNNDECPIKVVKPLCVYIASQLSDIVPSQKATFCGCLNSCLYEITQYMDFIGLRDINQLLMDIVEHISLYFSEYSRIATYEEIKSENEY